MSAPMDKAAREIPLTMGFIALVDEEDYDALAAFRWQARVVEERQYAYAVRSIKGTPRRALAMHNVILQTPPGFVVDHIEHRFSERIVDNRRLNLRVCTRIQNAQNRRKLKAGSSVYKGVWRHQKKGIWRALLRINTKLKIVGEFRDEIQAALAYDEAARHYFGEFARVNFPREGEASCL